MKPTSSTLLAAIACASPLLYLGPAGAQRRGIIFLTKVRAAFPAGARRFALGNAETLRRLDAIDPSFSTWAQALGAHSRILKAMQHQE